MLYAWFSAELKVTVKRHQKARPMPFTSAPSNIVRDDPRAAAIDAATRDDSHDARAHTSPAIKRPCPSCFAVVNQRCIAERYASGRPKVFAREFHPSRVALAERAQPERKITMTTTTTEKTVKPARPHSSKSAATRGAERAAADRKAAAGKPAPKPAAQPKPAPAAQPPELPAGKLTSAEKRALTKPIAAALAGLIDALPDDQRRPLIAQWITDSICRYLPRYADAEQRDPRLPEPTPFKS